MNLIRNWYNYDKNGCFLLYNKTAAIKISVKDAHKNEWFITWPSSIMGCDYGKRDDQVTSQLLLPLIVN